MGMKLDDLEPRWIGLAQWAIKSPFYVGVSFLCPHCKAKGACPTCGHADAKRLAVMFWPPIDPEQLMGRMFELPENKEAHRRIGGETFETLSLSPSVGFEGIGHWHGYITNGVATSTA